jgi:hypothetical protein
VFVRLGVFHDVLLSWAERPCVLTVTVSATGSELRFSGILRSYFSLTSLCGWALIPPQQHGGFRSLRLTALNLDQHEDRRVVVDADATRLRYVSRDAVFELERDQTLLTAPPRATTTRRYHYVGGRRRPEPEPWMTDGQSSAAVGAGTGQDTCRCSSSPSSALSPPRSPQPV